MALGDRRVLRGGARRALARRSTRPGCPAARYRLVAERRAPSRILDEALRAAGLGRRAADRPRRRPSGDRAAELDGQPAAIRSPFAAWAALGFASLGVLLGGAELMVVAIALPSIVADFGGWADLARVSWIVNAYLLAYVVAMPLAGRGADLWGALRLYVVALLLFVIGSAGAGLSRLAGRRTA